ncbi:MAG: ATP-binding protein [Bacteroidota bacterium]
MKHFSSKRISIILSLFFSIITGIAIGFTFIFDFSGYYLLYALFWILLSFIIYYISIYNIFNKYILKKIRPFFDTVDFLQMPESKLYSQIEEGEILKHIDEKFMEWAKSKVKEISTLKANEKYRKEFLGNVSHELKTPLFNIQGYISTLIDGGLDDANINLKYLHSSEKNINRLISVVEDLETISALESGSQRLDMLVFDILKLITEVMEMQEIRAKRKGIDLKLDKGGFKNVFVRADKKGISDVLSNLIINSIIYGKESGNSVISVRERDNKVFVHVIDDGIGIKEKNINRIFERFYRVDKSRSTLQGGTGLGLSIVKHIIEAHDQEIKVQSTLNSGCDFMFSLNKVETII